MFPLAVLIAGLVLITNTAYADVPTGTSMVVDTATPTLGQPVTLTATVTGGACPGVNCAAGRVFFRDGASAKIGSANLNGNATNQASFTIYVLSTGVHHLYADYEGAPGSFLSSSSAVSVDVTVGQRSTILTLGTVSSHVDVGSTLAVPGTVADIQPPLSAGGTAGSFSPSGPGHTLGTGRTGHTATLLLDGTILIAGGTQSGGGVLDSAELYDPDSDTFTTLFTTLHTGRYGHSATLLQNGTVLIAGGTDSSGTILRSTEVYDPVIRTFTVTVNLGTGRTGHTATTLPDGSVLITGGTGTCTPTPCTSPTLASVERYMSGSFSNVTGTLAAARSGHTATLLADGQHILITGGGDASAEVVTYNSGTNTVTPSATPSWTTARTGHTATLLPDGNVLITGGLQAGAAVNTVELYQVPSSFLTFAAFQRVTPATGLGTARASHTATLLNNGLVKFAGGIDATSPTPAVLGSAEAYTPAYDPLGQLTLVPEDISDVTTPCYLSLSGTGTTTCVNPPTLMPVALGTLTTRSVDLNYAPGSIDPNHSAPSPKTTTFTVNPGNPSFTGLSSPTITYGQGPTTLSGTILPTLDGPTGVVTISVNGESHDAPIGTGGAFSASFATGTYAAASYAITYHYPADGNFNLFDGSAILLVNKATPTINWTNPADITYGTALSATQLDAVAKVGSSVVPGTFIYSPPAGTVLNVGSGQVLSVHFAPTDGSSYNTPTDTTVNVNVNPARVTPTLSVSNSLVTYNGSSQAATVTGSVPGTVSNVKYNGSSTVPSNAATYAITADFVPADSTNYSSLAGASAGNFVVNTAPLTVTADNKTKVYGAPPPAFTVSYAGFVNGETPSALSGTLNCITTATLTSTVGSYAITCSGQASGNYAITYVPGQLSIAQDSTSTAIAATTIILGQPATLTASVTAVAPGSGTPTGTVTFKDGTTTLGTGVLTSGQASLTTSALSVGSHAITAQYGGDADFIASSGSFTQQVKNNICALYDQTKSVQSGANVPIKLYLCDVNGSDVSSPSLVLQAIQVIGISGYSGSPESPGNSNPDADFVFDSTLGTTGGYRFNLKTTGLPSGTYTLTFAVTNDPATHSVNFGVK